MVMESRLCTRSASQLFFNVNNRNNITLFGAHQPTTTIDPPVKLDSSIPASYTGRASGTLLDDPKTNNRRTRPPVLILDELLTSNGPMFTTNVICNSRKKLLHCRAGTMISRRRFDGTTVTLTFGVDCCRKSLVRFSESLLFTCWATGSRMDSIVFVWNTGILSLFWH